MLPLSWGDRELFWCEQCSDQILGGLQGTSTHFFHACMVSEV